MYRKKEIIVIIDAFSNGIHYAPIFSGLGFQCVHIHSNYDHFKNWPWGENFFIDSLMFRENNIDELIKKIQKYEVKAVIPGCEMGVFLADIISNHLNVPRNDFLKTKARRNKFLMIEELKKENIPCAKQFCSNDLSKFINWYRDYGLSRIVIKPILSTTSDGVRICMSDFEIEEAFNAIFGKVNFLGTTNEELVMQEYLSGPEYIVNSVSCHGKHFITDIWLGVGGIENTISTDEYTEMVKKSSPEYMILKNYTERVLDALGILNGPAHAEIKYTPTGPKLIEIGARLAGLFDFSVIQKCLGYSQLSVAAETYLNPELFFERTAIYERLRQKEFMRFVYFNSNMSGVINKDISLDKFLTLDSIKSVKFTLEKGDYLEVTSKSIGRSGYASMLSDSMENLKEDYKKFRKIEDTFYKKIIE